MNCTDVRENLSAYIDDMLDRQMRDLMDTHLSGCKECRQELAAMRALVEELRNTGEMKAPQDFLETLHERLETESFWSRLREFLFVPAQIKIPLEFATISVIGVLIFSLYSIYSPQENLRILSQDSAMKSSVVLEKASQPSSPSISADEDEASEYVQATKQQPIELALILPHKADIGGQGLAEEKEEIPPSAAAMPAQRQKDSEGIDYKAHAAGKAVPDVKAGSSIEKPAAQIQATPKEEKTSEHDLPEIVQKLHELIGLSGGRILSEEPDREGREKRIIFAEIPAVQYKNFIDKVLNLAQVQEPLPEIPGDQEAPVLIRIRLVAEK